MVGGLGPTSHTNTGGVRLGFYSEKKHKTVGEWSHVSREFFLRGDQTSYKSGKNCRERWLNHLDPSISKEWTREEDIRMLHIVR